MYRFLLKTTFIMILGFMYLGCAAKGPVSPLPTFTPQMLDASNYTSKVDNFIVIFDGSSSMGEYSLDQKKFTVARAVVSRMNQTLPELGQTAGIRSFGHHKTVSKKHTMLFYGMAPYSTDSFKKGFDPIKAPGGTSPLYKALDAARTDLEKISGKTALLIISDGKDMGALAVASAKTIKDAHGASLCIYPILVGDDTKGQALMESLADIGGCGFFTQAQSILSNSGMTQFVEKVFLSKRAVVTPMIIDGDDDGDGVKNSRDKCPGTPQGVPVDQDGCPFDEDRDGVYDYKDDCLGTPQGAMVNDRGCWIIGGVLFDFDKSDIKAQEEANLNKVLRILEKNPDLHIVLEGHTCNRGSKKYNQSLSLRRAQAVKVYLVSKGIHVKRLSCKGFGLSRPIASNSTEEGRVKNRRTELKPIK